MRKQRAERLRFAVNSLPPETRRAMLDGIEQNRIVTGANTDRRGGVCPMLAADRESFNVTPLAEIFATAWDRYTGTSFVNVTRRTASDRDLNVLRSMLETSLTLNPGVATELADAVRDIRAETEPQPTAVVRPDLVETSRVLTAAARIEVMRALEATGHAPRLPALRPEPAHSPPAAGPEAAAPRPAAHPETAPATAVPVEPARYAARVESASSARPALHRVAASAASERRPAAANKTQTELDRERARAIVANQASTLRSRAWPRPAEPAQELAAVAPAAVPAPAPAAHAAPAPAPQLGDRDRTSELQSATGWAWLRPFSSYEDYERTLNDLGEMERGPRGADPRADDGGHRRATKRPEPTPA